MKKQQIPLDELDTKNNVDETEIRSQPAKSEPKVN
jgi:hypothetical protein